MPDHTDDGDITTETQEPHNTDIDELTEQSDSVQSVSDQTDQADSESTESDQAEDESSESSIGILDAKQRAQEAAAELLEYEFEGVIKVETAADNWRTVIEVVERSAVPDTQDIIGRYEISLDATGNVTGYELLERYRRGEMKEEL